MPLPRRYIEHIRRAYDCGGPKAASRVGRRVGRPRPCKEPPSPTQVARLADTYPEADHLGHAPPERLRIRQGAGGQRGDAQ
jgi:hypothetical protein